MTTATARTDAGGLSGRRLLDDVADALRARRQGYRDGAAAEALVARLRAHFDASDSSGGEITEALIALLREDIATARRHVDDCLSTGFPSPDLRLFLALEHDRARSGLFVQVAERWLDDTNLSTEYVVPTLEALEELGLHRDALTLARRLPRVTDPRWVRVAIRVAADLGHDDMVERWSLRWLEAAHLDEPGTEDTLRTIVSRIPRRLNDALVDAVLTGPWTSSSLSAGVTDALLSLADGTSEPTHAFNLVAKCIGATGAGSRDSPDRAVRDAIASLCESGHARAGALVAEDLWNRRRGWRDGLLSVALCTANGMRTRGASIAIRVAAVVPDEQWIDPLVTDVLLRPFDPADVQHFADVVQTAAAHGADLSAWRPLPHAEIESAQHATGLIHRGETTAFRVFALNWSLAVGGGALPASLVVDGLIEGGDVCEARSLAVVLHRRYPDDPAAIHRLATTLGWLGRDRDAAELARSAFEVSPDIPHLLPYLVETLGPLAPREAIRAIDRDIGDPRFAPLQDRLHQQRSQLAQFLAG